MKRHKGPVRARLAGEANRNATSIPRSALVVTPQRFELNADHVAGRERRRRKHILAQGAGGPGAVFGGGGRSGQDDETEQHGVDQASRRCAHHRPSRGQCPRIAASAGFERRAVTGGSVDERRHQPAGTFAKTAIGALGEGTYNGSEGARLSASRGPGTGPAGRCRTG